MAKGLKGITVEIDGNVQPLNKALTSVNANAKSLQSELKGVNTLLKTDPSNVELQAQKQVILSDAISETEAKLKLLAQAEKDAAAAGKDINDEGYRNLQREIILTKTRLDDLKGQQATFQKLSTAAETFGTKIANIANKIPVVNKLATAFGTVKDKITGAVSNNEKIQKIGTSVQAAKDKVGQLAEKIPIIGKIGTAFQGAGEAVEKVKDKLPPLSTAIKATGDAAAAAAKGGFTVLTSVVGGTVKAVAGFGTAAGAALISVAKQAITQYADYEQLVGGVETLFKGSAGTVEKYADNAYKTAGLSANAYMETVTSFSASLLQSMNGDTEAAAKKADQAITDMSDNANKMGTSMDSIQTTYQGFAKQNFTMLDNLKLGYGGTKEEMQRLLDDATKLSGVEYDVSSYADIVDAIHVVQTEMGITGTTAKEASTTISGSINSAKGAWENLLTGFANDEADVGALIDDLMESVISVLDNLAPRVLQSVGSIIAAAPELIGRLSEVTMGLMGQAEGMLGGLIDPLINGFFGLLDSAIAMMPTLMPKLLNAAITVFSGLLNGLNQTIPKLMAMIPTLITSITGTLTANLPQIITAGIQILVNLINGITNAVPSLITAIVALIPVIVTAILDNLPAIITAGLNLLIALITGIIDAIPQLIVMLPTIIITIVQTLLTMLPQIIMAGIQLLTALTNGLVQAIPTLVLMLPQIISSIINTLIKNLPQIISAGIQLLGALVSGLIQAIPALIAALPQIVTAIFDTLGAINWGELGTNIIAGIKDGVISAAQSLAQAVADAARAALDAAKSALGIHSPSRVFRDEVGKQMAAGMAIGFEEENANRAAEMANSIPTTFDSYMAANKSTATYSQEASAAAGFTQNITINSPKEVSPSETARQTRNATRQMVLKLQRA